MPALGRKFKLILLALALCLGTGHAVQGEDREGVPDSRACAAARAVVDEAFKYESVGNDPAKRLEMALKLVEAAKTGRDSAAIRYVELCRARDLAAGVDLGKAIEISDQLVKSFQVDTWQTKVEVLSVGSVRPTVPAVESVISWANDAIRSDHLDAARRLVAAAASFASKMNDPVVLADAHESSKELAEAEKQVRIVDGLKARLNAHTDDIETRLELGKLLCVTRDKWNDGLLLLQKSPDVRLRSAVMVELGNPLTPAAMLTAADDWWEVAETDHAFPVRAARSRAAMWYRRALPELAGIDRVRVELRLDDAAKHEELNLPEVAGKWIALSWSGVKWESSKRPVTVTCEMGSYRLTNPGPAKVYFVNDRIVSGDFALAITANGTCLIGLLSADRTDHSLFCNAANDGHWHEVRFQRKEQLVTAYEDNAPAQVKSYNGSPAMTGVLGFVLDTGQSVEIRSLIVR